MSQTTHFDPSLCSVVVETEQRALRAEDRSDFVWEYRARVYPVNEITFRRAAAPIAAVAWVHLAAREAAARGFDPVEVAGAHDRALAEVVDRLLRERGAPADPTSHAPGLASDLACITELRVQEGIDFVPVARELVEYVLTNHTAGCAALAHLRREEDHPLIDEVLAGRRFRRLRGAAPGGAQVMVADLVGERAALDAV